MYKFFAAFFFVIIAGDRYNSLADSFQNKDFETQCNVHFFSRMGTMMDYVVANQERWDTCKELKANETRAEESHKESQFEAKLDRMEGQLVAVQESLKNAKTQDFVEKVGRTDARLTALENKIQSMQSKLDNQVTAIQQVLSKLDRKVIPPGFDKIGSRYFYIENNSQQTWISANSTCIEKGGHLASIKNHEELISLKTRLDDYHFYWLGIYEQATKGNFVSVASGKPAAYISWKLGEPNYLGFSLHCVVMREGLMYVDTCNVTTFNFICQADDNV